MEQNKTFDEWNEQKKELAQNNDMYKMNEADLANITEQLKAFLDKSKPRF